MRQLCLLFLLILYFPSVMAQVTLDSNHISQKFEPAINRSLRMQELKIEAINEMRTFAMREQEPEIKEVMDNYTRWDNGETCTFNDGDLADKLKNYLEESCGIKEMAGSCSELDTKKEKLKQQIRQAHVDLDRAQRYFTSTSSMKSTDLNYFNNQLSSRMSKIEQSLQDSKHKYRVYCKYDLDKMVSLKCRDVYDYVLSGGSQDQVSEKCSASKLAQTRDDFISHMDGGVDSPKRIFEDSYESYKDLRETERKLALFYRSLYLLHQSINKHLETLESRRSLSSSGAKND